VASPQQDRKANVMELLSLEPYPKFDLFLAIFFQCTGSGVHVSGEETRLTSARRFMNSFAGVSFTGYRVDVLQNCSIFKGLDTGVNVLDGTTAEIWGIEFFENEKSHFYIQTQCYFDRSC
jgi:hypothetical protein